MSRIYFHSLSKTVEVYGPERHHMSRFCTQLMLNCLDIEPLGLENSNRIECLKKMIPEKSHIWKYQMDDFERVKNIKSALLADHDIHFILNNKKVFPLELALNTAYKLGNDVVKLFARIHGQCEIHAWIEGKNRRWIAGIIEHGLKIGLYRSDIRGDDLGWSGLVEFLRSGDKEPVVMSYSVCRSFPNAVLLGFKTEEDINRFDGLSDETQWKLCMKVLRQCYPSLEISQETWSDYYFENGVTAFDINIELARLQKEIGDVKER